MRRPSLRQTVALLLAAAASLVLTGCLKVDVDLEVSRFDTFSGSVVVAVAEDLAAFSDEDPTTGIFDDVFQENPGVSVETFRQDGYVGEKAVFEGAPFAALDEFSDDQSTLSLRRDNNHVVFEGTFDFASEDADDAGFFGDQLLALASDMEVSVSFPGNVVETNGQLEEDSNTVTWEPKLGDTTYFYAKAESGQLIPWWAWLVIGPGIAGIGFVVWRTTMKNRSQSDGTVSEAQG